MPVADDLASSSSVLTFTSTLRPGSASRSNGVPVRRFVWAKLRGTFPGPQRAGMNIHIRQAIDF